MSDADLSAKRHAELAIEAARPKCFGIGGGRIVMRCARLCAANGLAMPEWLAAQFVNRCAPVDEARLGSWDEAFGRPWPRGEKRLAAACQRIKLKALVHSLVWRMALSENDLPINTALFALIGNDPRVCSSASRVSRLYYEAVGEGALDVAKMLRLSRASSTNCAVILTTGTAVSDKAPDTIEA